MIMTFLEGVMRCSFRSLFTSLFVLQVGIHPNCEDPCACAMFFGACSYLVLLLSFTVLGRTIVMRRLLALEKISKSNLSMASLVLPY